MSTPQPVAPATAAHTGMGAIPYDGGVTFRVWQLFGASVSVVINNGAPVPMAQDGTSNYWSVDVPGATVGQPFRFNIPSAAQPTQQSLKVDPYARSIQQPGGVMQAVITGNTIAYIPGSYTTPSWNQAVIYELHIPTFSTQADGSPGTLDSALPNLSMLADIGINAIEILPLNEFEGGNSTGYNPGYIFAVEDSYGGPDGLRDFVNQAHALGIAVILDVVYNHLNATDLWQFDGWSENNTCPYDQYPTNGGIYFYEDNRAHTDFSHARFDYGRPEVCQYLVDNVNIWLQNRFLDGLRFDSVVNIRAVQDNGKIMTYLPDGTALLQRMTSTVAGSQGWKIMIAEDLQGDSAITAPVSQGGYGFTAQWNDDLCYSLRNAATAPLDSGRNIAGLAGNIAWISNGNAFKSVAYSENHDKDDPNQGGGRLPAIIGNGNAGSWNAQKQSTLAAAVVLTIPGIPMLFEGQEFLEFAPFPNSNGTPAAVDWTLRNTYSGITNLYRDLIHLRRNWFNNTSGLTGPNANVLPVFADNVLVYHRWDQGGPGDDVIVVCNFSNQSYSSYAIGLPRQGMWHVRLNSDSTYYGFGGWDSLDTQANGPALNGMPFSGNIGIGAYSCVILSQ